MKKLFTVLVAVILTATLWAQSPQKMSYQAVIRNASNNSVVNTIISMKISIIHGSISGTAVYVETQNPTTNANGLVSIEIGGGTIVSGNFASINWANGPYYIKTETDPTGGNNYTIIGTSQLLSVPYALHAKTADSIATTKVLMPPVTSTTAVSDILPFSATLRGLVNGSGFTTSVDFEWGLTTDYGNTATATQSPIKGATNVVVSKPITGLQSSTTYHYRIKATNPIDITYSDDMSFTTAISTPQLTTTAVTSITSNSASSGGNITYDGGSAVSVRGVCWSTSSNPTITNNKTTDGTGSGTFISSISGLSTNTTYYLRAYATNGVETAYGEEKTFNTLPTLVTTEITSVTNTTANSGGTISGGSAAITARGVCWSTSQNPTTSNSKTTNGTGLSPFSSSISGLTGNTTYYVRAYATNSGGTAYGTQVSFTTLPTVTTKTIEVTTSNLITSTATSGGTISGSGSITARGVCWSTSPNPTINNAKTSDGASSGTFNSSITGLTFNTTYYLRAYATNSVGTSYGNEVTFNSGIGANYQGGKIAYIFQSSDPGYIAGQTHGLIAAPSDLNANVAWFCSSIANGSALGSGYQNTLNIVACSPNNNAAQLCNDLVLNGYSDWYLPSLDELNKLYLNKNLIGGFTTVYYDGVNYYNTNYLSSTGSAMVWEQDFNHGYQENDLMYSNYEGHIRPIRSF